MEIFPIPSNSNFSKFRMAWNRAARPSSPKSYLEMRRSISFFWASEIFCKRDIDKSIHIALHIWFLYIRITSTTWLICKGVSGLSSVDVWDRGLNICLLYVGPFLTNLFWTTVARQVSYCEEKVICTSIFHRRGIFLVWGFRNHIVICIACCNDCSKTIWQMDKSYILNPRSAMIYHKTSID